MEKLETYQNKLEGYKNLITKTYPEAIKYLKEKYGNVTDNYFKEKSYQKFLNGEIKSISKGKFSRTKEGLYTHHIAESSYLNLSNQKFIKLFKYTYDTQLAENLVYTDLIEHLILHVIISRETNHEFGQEGYDAFLRPNVVDWYLRGIVPEMQWQRACYDRSFLEVADTIKLLELTDKALIG